MPRRSIHFAAVYHEYTHLELGIDGMPLWLNEGLAEFFQNTDIRDKTCFWGSPVPTTLSICANTD